MKCAPTFSRLFDLRHAACHEAPAPAALQFDLMLPQLLAARDFVHAMEEVLTFKLFGKVPLTQTAMNLEAGRRFDLAQTDMDKALNEFRRPGADNSRGLKLLNSTQHAWERYRHLQCIFAFDPEGGGSIGPMIRSAEAEILTIERTNDLRRFLDRKEAEL